MRKDLLKKNFMEVLDSIDQDLIRENEDVNFINFYVDLLDEKIPEEELTYAFFNDLARIIDELQSDLIYHDFGEKAIYYQIIRRTLGWNDKEDREKIIQKIKEMTLDSDTYDFEDEEDDYEEFDFEDENDLY